MHPNADSSTRQPRRRTANQWRAIVDRFQQSGLHEKEFCRQENLIRATFARWRRNFLTEDRRPGFVELQPLPTATGPSQDVWTVEVDLPGGGSLRLRSGR